MRDQTLLCHRHCCETWAELWRCLLYGACLTVHTLQYACYNTHLALEQLTHADEVARDWLSWAMALLWTQTTSGTQAYVPCVLATVAASLPALWLDTSAAEYDASTSCG